jgi:hypothetical protein
LDTGHKKQQQNTELVGWLVCLLLASLNHTLHNAQQRHWLGQLNISHIKQQVVYPCNHTIKHGSKAKTKCWHIQMLIAEQQVKTKPHRPLPVNGNYQIRHE